ncbi:MAG: hypothetical protein LAN70_12560 [Acidobacteriia bacterium]|nr:hypothetical protein [Terriglobia bacterium]
MPNGTRLLRSVGGCLAALFISVLIALFFISHLMPPLWHAMRGNSVSVAEWRVRVPKGYSRLWGDNSFYAFSFGAPFINRRYASVYVYPHTPLPAVSPQQIESAVVTVARTDGYVLGQRKIVESTAGTNYCFQFSDPLQADHIVIRCMTATRNLSVFFNGDRRFSDDFYAVVSGIQRL